MEKVRNNFSRQRLELIVESNAWSSCREGAEFFLRIELLVKVYGQRLVCFIK